MKNGRVWIWLANEQIECQAADCLSHVMQTELRAGANHTASGNTFTTSYYCWLIYTRIHRRQITIIVIVYNVT